MESPPSRIGSKTQGLSGLRRDSKSQAPDLSTKDSKLPGQSGLAIDSKSHPQIGSVEGSISQIQNGLVEERKSLTQLGLAEERKSQTQLGLAEERKSQTQLGLAEESKSLTQLGLAEERKSQTQLGLAEERKSQTQLGLVEERKSQTQLGLAEERRSQTQLGLAEGRRSQTQLGLAEGRRSQTQLGLSEEPLDLKDWVAQQLELETAKEIREKVLEDEEAFLRQKAEEATSLLPGSLWIDPQHKQAVVNELQELKEQIEEKRKSVTEIRQRSDSKKINLVTTLEKLEERRQTLTENLEALEERRKTLMETLDDLEERRKTLMEIPEGLEERRRILMETLEGLEEKRKTLMQSSEGLEEKKKSLIDTLEELEQRRRTLSEIDSLEERKKTTVDILARPEERKRSLRPLEQHVSDERRSKSFHGYPLSHKMASKKSKTDTRRVSSKPTTIIQPKFIPRYIPPKPKPQTADKATQLRAIPIFPLRLPGFLPAHSKHHTKADSKPSLYENGTQITSSFERLMKRPPPPVFKRKRSKTKSISSIFSSSSSSSDSKGSIPVCRRGSRNSNRSLEWLLRQRCCVIERGDRPYKRCHLYEGGPRSMKKLMPERAPHSHSHKFKPIERASRTHSKFSAMDRDTFSHPRVRSADFDRGLMSHAIERPKRSHSRLTSIDRPKRSHSRLNAVERAAHPHSKFSAVERAARPHSKFSAVERPSCSENKRNRGNQIVYNFYVNLCDCCKEEEPCIDYIPCNWTECAPCAGLSRACNLFGTLKAGAIEVADLLMALHTLGILVTHDEMQQTLKCVEIQGGNVNFGEFLEVVNQCSPFAETDALQNTVRAFRKIKDGMVNFCDLESVLGYLGVEMSYGDIRRILKCPQVCKIDMVDLSEFFEAARDLDYPMDDEVCASDLTFWERKPFQDVTSLISGKARWRRRYDSFEEEDVCGSWPCSKEDIICPMIDQPQTTDHQQRMVSMIPITVTDVDAENKDNDITDEPKSTSEIAEPEKQDSMEKTQSQTEAADQGKSNTSIVENKLSGVKIIKLDISDPGKSSTASIHNIEAEKKG